MAALHNIRAIVDFGQQTDHRVMRRIHGWHAPRWMRWWMLSASRAGDGWIWYLSGLMIAIFGGENRVPALVAGAIASGSGILLFRKLKRAFGRKRPCHLAPHCWSQLLPPDQFSFPSGHTITAFAVAISLGAFYHQLLPGFLFCAASVAASRILLGMHFLTDVLAGAAIGTVLGTVAAACLV